MDWTGAGTLANRWVGFEAGVVQCGPGTVGNSECATQSLQSIPTAPLLEVVEEVVDEGENCWGRASAGMEGPQPPFPWPYTFLEHKTKWHNKQ